MTSQEKFLIRMVLSQQTTIRNAIQHNEGFNQRPFPIPASASYSYMFFY